MTKLLANEWAGKGINVNAIAPGYIATNNTAALQADETRNRSIMKRIQAGRCGDPSDLGGPAVFLASRAANYVQGAYTGGGWRLARALTLDVGVTEMVMGRFLAFGEIMLRLSPPGRELLLQTPRLDIWVAGAEANVVTQLARLGHDVGMATMVPDNDLGRAAIATLRGHGVDPGAIQLGGERMGLYFVTSGAGLRATEVIYDRAWSSFARAPASAWDWDVLLHGVDRLHLSGITPALGPIPAQSAIAAAKAAEARGVPISFDGNWRGKLWERWESNPRAILTELVSRADLMFGNHRDIALLLGMDFSGDAEDRRREAAEAAFAAFPTLKTIASTARHVEHVDLHRLSARVDTRDGHAQTDEVVLAGIVDRIGGGDAFAAGVLHALRTGGDSAAAAVTGLALAALKHSLPGDASLFRQPDIDAYLAGGLDVRR